MLGYGSVGPTLKTQHAQRSSSQRRWTPGAHAGCERCDQLLHPVCVSVLHQTIYSNNRPTTSRPLALPSAQLSCPNQQLVVFKQRQLRYSSQRPCIGVETVCTGGLLSSQSLAFFAFIFPHLTSSPTPLLPPPPPDFQQPPPISRVQSPLGLFSISLVILLLSSTPRYFVLHQRRKSVHFGSAKGERDAHHPPASRLPQGPAATPSPAPSSTALHPAHIHGTMEYTSHPRQTVLPPQSHNHLASAPISSEPTNSATLPFPFPFSPSNSTPEVSAPATMASPPALSGAGTDDAMADAVSAPAPAAPSTRGGRGRGRGRGSARGRGRVAKPAQPKAASGRGRRQKMYESARCQAAHERMQELRSSYAVVAKAVKPVALEIADQSLNELASNPDIFKQVPEYDEVQSFLKERLADAKSTIDMERDVEFDMLRHLYAGQQEITHSEFNVSVLLLGANRLVANT